MKKFGFTLVEVALSIAIVSFALITMLGLLSIGLAADQQSIQQSRATQAMSAVATGIWGMTPIVANTNYGLAMPMNTNITVGSAPVAFTWGLKENGLLSNANDFVNNPDLVGTVYVKCTPPADVNSAGTAYITVAWPGYAQYVTSGTTGSWTKQQGYVETTIYFNLPTSN